MGQIEKTITAKVKELKELKDFIESLEKQEEALTTEIMEMLDDDNISNMNTPYGHVWIMGRTTYEYSPAVKELNEKLYALKKKEEATGVAVIKTAGRHIRLTKPDEQQK